MPITVRTPPSRDAGPRARRPARAAARTALAALALLGAACNWGTRPKDFPPARGPEGATVVIQLSDSPAELRGELFAVDSVGVIVRAPRLTRVAWTRVDALSVRQLGADYSVWRRRRPPDALRARLARVSRFPQGLAEPLLGRVIALMQQPALEEIR
jgi:hypothetical protein